MNLFRFIALASILISSSVCAAVTNNNTGVTYTNPSLSNLPGIVPISHGGTGSPTPGGAAINLGNIKKFPVGAYGALGVATDDCPAIQSAFNAAKAYGLGGVVVFDSISYKCQTPLTVDVVTMIEGNNARLDARTMSTGIVMTVVQANNDTYEGFKSNFRNFSIYGPGKTSTVDGIKFSSVTSSSSVRSAWSNIAIRDVRYGEICTNHCYLVEFHDSSIARTTTGVRVESGGSDYGESINWYAGVIGESTTAIDVLATGAGVDMNFFGVSIDYNGTMVHQTVGHLTFVGGHFETDGAGVTGPEFTLDSGNGVSMDVIGGDFVLTGTGPFSGASCIAQVDGASQLYISNVRLHNTWLTSKTFACGTGLVKIKDTHNYGTANQNVILRDIASDASLSLIPDGSFESTTIKANGFIVGDTAVITDRNTGVNIQASTSTDTAYSGSRSLKLTKVGASGTSATYVLAIPLPPQQTSGISLYLSKLGSQTGTLHTVTRFANLNGNDGNGIPIIGQTQLITDNSTSLTSSALTWTQMVFGTTGTAKTPAWATHLLIYIDLTSVNAGDIYYDYIIFSSL